MARAKAKTTKAAAAESSKAYRHTRTGAIRHSTSPLGYPYEAVDTKVEKVTGEEAAE